MQCVSDEGNSSEEGKELLECRKNKVNALSQIITKDLVAAAGINVDTPIISAIIGNLTGTFPVNKQCAKQVKCKVCNCLVSSYISFEKHVIGAKHQRKLKDLEVFSKLNVEKNNRIQKSQKSRSHSFVCEICSLEVNSAMQLQNHLSGGRHKKKTYWMKTFELDKDQKPDNPDKEIQQISAFEQKKEKNEVDPLACYICNVSLNSKNQQSEHMKSKKHLIKEALWQKIKKINQESFFYSNGRQCSTY